VDIVDDVRVSAMLSPVYWLAGIITSRNEGIYIGSDKI